jgi:hypothetical protein
MLYLSTRDERPLQKFAGLTVEPLVAKADAVRQWFSLPVIRFVGAYTGCSCGFKPIIAEQPIAWKKTRCCTPAVGR